MSKDHNWQQFFDWHAPDYMQNAFTSATEDEIAFLVEHLGLAEGHRVLDIGCGTGRHSVRLAALGCDVTGVDISAGMLAQAKQAAADASVEVNWVQADASRYQPDANAYDAVICLCEGAFTLLSASDDPLEHDLAIARSAYHALKPGGQFVLTALNALRHARSYTQDDVDAGRYDPLTLTEQVDMSAEIPNAPKAVVRERGYTAPELQLMFRMVGFEVEHVGGGTAGNWGLRPLELDEYEIMIIGRKPSA